MDNNEPLFEQITTPIITYFPDVMRQGNVVTFIATIILDFICNILSIGFLVQLLAYSFITNTDLKNAHSERLFCAICAICIVCVFACTITNVVRYLIENSSRYNNASKILKTRTIFYLCAFILFFIVSTMEVCVVKQHCEFIALLILVLFPLYMFISLVQYIVERLCGYNNSALTRRTIYCSSVAGLFVIIAVLKFFFWEEMFELSRTLLELISYLSLPCFDGACKNIQAFSLIFVVPFYLYYSNTVLKKYYITLREAGLGKVASVAIISSFAFIMVASRTVLFVDDNPLIENKLIANTLLAMLCFIEAILLPSLFSSLFSRIYLNRIGVRND